MVKRIWLAMCIVCLLCSTAFAGNWTIGAEVANVEQEIDYMYPVVAGYQQVYTTDGFTDVDFINGNLSLMLDDVHIQNYLVSVGYWPFLLYLEGVEIVCDTSWL